MSRTKTMVVAGLRFVLSGIVTIQMSWASTDSSHLLVQDLHLHTRSTGSMWMWVTNQDLKDEFRLDGLPPISRQLIKDREQMQEFMEFLKQREREQEQRQKQ